MKRYLTPFLLFFSMLTVYAQNSVNVTVNIVPPYSTRLSDYANNPGKTLITLRNTTTRPLDIYLRINITGENGVRVFTDPAYRAPVPVTLQPGVPKILNVAEIQTLFNLSDITFVSTTANDIERKNGLPEGVYSLCVRAYDFARPTVPLSAESPLGCTTLRLTLTEPPILIRPMEDEELTVMEPQNTLFSWTIPAGAPPGTLYLLKIVEMFDPNRNPNDAFLSSMGPAFFEKEVMGNTYVYGPADPPLVKGRKYAWSVKALDKTIRGGGEGTAFRNEGRSEVRSFTPKAGAGGIVAVDRVTGNDRPPLVAQDVSPAFQIVQLKGKLRYYWMQAGSASDINNLGNPASGGSGNSAGNKPRNLQSSTPAVQAGPSQNTGMSFTGNTSGFSGYQNSPLAGVTVQLVEALQFENPVITGSLSGTISLLPGNILTGYESSSATSGNSISPGVLATSVTDAGGNFSFNIPNLDDLDFGWKQTSISKSGVEFNYHISGRSRKVLMVRIGTPAASYYAQPIQYTFGIPGHQDMGTFYSRVRTFNPTVLVAEKTSWNLTKENMEVLLVRKNPRPSYIPKDEGSPGDFSDPETHGGLNYEIVAKAVTNANGIAAFRNIVVYYCNNYESPYLIFVRPRDENTTSQSLNSVFPYGQKLRYATVADYNNPACFNISWSSHQLAGSCYSTNCLGGLTKINAGNYSLPGQDPSFDNFTFAPVSPWHPRIYALAKNKHADNDNELAQNEPGAVWALWRINLPTAEEARNIAYNGKWGELLESNQTGFNWLSGQLSNRGLPLQLQKVGVTGNDGRIDAKDLPVEYYSGIQKGYFWALSVEKNGFKPAFKAINIGVAPTIGDMAPAKFGSAYNGGTLYLEPKGEIKVRLVNEQGAPIKGKVHYFDPATGQTGNMVNVSASGGYYSVHLPSGNNRKLMLLPYDTDLYQADTAIIDVPAGQVIQKDLVVKYKLHRIHFKIEGSGLPPAALTGVKISLTGLLPSNVTMYPGVHSPYINQGAYSNMPNNIPGNNPQNNSPYVNANDPLPELLGPFDRVTNSSGRADFAFRNAGTGFTFRIRGPKDSDYIVVDKIISSTPSKNWQVVTVKLKKGRTVKGRVTVGTENSPVAGARVRVKGSVPLIEVFSNAAGEYEMKAVPADTILTFTVSKGGQGLVGLEYTEGGTQVKTYGIVSQYQNQYPVTNQPGGAPIITTINFRMRIYNDLNLNELLGFPLEVTNLTETAGKVIINGILTIPDTQDDVFRISGTNVNGQTLRTLDIANTTLQADSRRDTANIPYCKPAVLPVITEINEQPVILYGSYTSLLQGESTNGPVVLNKYGSGQQEQGAVLGRVSVSAASFNSNIFRYGENEQMFLKRLGAGTLAMPVFTSSGTAVVSGGIPIVNAQGDDFRYTLNYSTDVFTAISKAKTSRLYKDSVVLDTRLQTSLQHISPANLDLTIGKVLINSEHQLSGFTNSVQKNLPMGRFSMDLTRITGNNSGIYLRGIIHAMGADLPFNNALLHTDRIHLPQGALNVSQLTLLGNLPMEVTAQATFGYNGAEQAWYLSVTANDNSVTAASISGQYLNGVNNDARINFSSLWFYSNGRQELFLTNAVPTLTVHNAARFYVQSVELGDDVLGLNGSLDPGIPSLPSYNTGLLYSRTGNNTPSAMTLRPFSMGPVLVQGVRWHFDYGDSRSIVFTQGKIVLKGHLESENTRVFKGIRYTLTKTNLDANQLAGNLRTELDVDAGQSAIMGGSDNGRIIVSAITGKMTVSNGAWSIFTFDGDMPEEMGFRGNNKRMSFAAENHLSVRNSTIQLKNVESPFGDLTMTYDIQNFRLLGQLNYTGDMEAMQVNADIEFAVDQYGYYFLSAARMTMNNPTVNAQGFLLFGNYEHKVSDRRGAIENIIREYSYYSQNMDGELPKGYVQLNALNGFFMEVGAEIPFPLIPNFDIDLGVVSARLKVTIGGDVRFGINFGNSNSYTMGMSVFVNAEFGLGASVGLACAGVELKAKAGVNMDGTYWSNGNYSLEVSGYISLTGTAYAGFSPVGLPSCDSDCDGACVKEEVSGTIRLDAVGLVTHTNSSFELALSSNSF